MTCGIVMRIELHDRHGLPHIMCWILSCHMIQILDSINTVYKVCICVYILSGTRKRPRRLFIVVSNYVLNFRGL